MLVLSRAYISLPTSMYELDSFTNRLPAASTYMVRGRWRAWSSVDCPKRPVRGEGSHHASSIRSVWAPMAMAARMASPVSPGLEIDHLA